MFQFLVVVVYTKVRHNVSDKQNKAQIVDFIIMVAYVFY